MTNFLVLFRSGIRRSVDARGNGTIYFIPIIDEKLLTTKDIRQNKKRQYPTFELMEDVVKLQKELVHLWQQRA